MSSAATSPPRTASKSAAARATRFWREWVDVVLVRVVLVASCLFLVAMGFHIFYLGVIDRVGVTTHCLGPEARARAEALRPPPYAGNDSRQALLERFAPVVVMHSGERYMPVSWPDFVASSSLRAYRDEKVAAGHVDEAVLRDWMSLTPRTTHALLHNVALMLVPNDDSLGGSRGNLSDVPFYGQARLVCIRPGADGGRQSDTCDRAAQGLAAGPYGACDQLRAPGKRETPGRFWELRYAFLSANNGPETVLGFIPIGAHRGDIEHVTVRVAADERTVFDVFYGTHTVSEGRYFHPHDLDFVDGTHPVVYSAVNSHASYPYCGTIRRRGFLRLIFPHDHTDDSGRVWRPRTVVSVDSPDPGGEGALFRDFTGNVGSEEVASLTRQVWWCSEDDYSVHRFPYVVS